MEIQSLSIAVPAGCPNKCKFCVSGMHENDYPNLIGTPAEPERAAELVKQYMKRMQFARDNGCNTMMVTGSGEPLANKEFLNGLARWNSQLRDPFLWIEIQTSGVFLDSETLYLLRDKLGVSTVSLSLSDMFDDVANAQMNGTPRELWVDIQKTCKSIKDFGMNLRLSLNMTDTYNGFSPEYIFQYAREHLEADQITFRELYQSEDLELPQNKWIEEHACNYQKLHEIKQYIQTKGTSLELLPFGSRKYSVHGMSVVVDEDCMSKQADKVLKYLILRSDCKLYSRWDDRGSLFF